MASPVRELLENHSTNPVKKTGLMSSSNETWARSYQPIKKPHVHTFVYENGVVGATFEDAFLDLYEDDELRMQELAYPPNHREWRLANEEDGINWFHNEVSNIVLAAWARYPNLLQTHEKPPTETRVSESTNIAYSVKRGSDRVHIAMGEFKRCLIDFDQWQKGELNHVQRAFSQELRGYAYLYRCPQIFCFDNETFLMLQFRATTLESIRDPDCAVDCWVLPRDNPKGMPIRWALYRLLVQGFRRCQGLWSLKPSLYNTPPDRREFYNGRPLWKVDGRLKEKPWGLCRRIDPAYGAFYWTDAEGSEPLEDEAGGRVWDTLGFWEPHDE